MPNSTQMVNKKPSALARSLLVNRRPIKPANSQQVNKKPSSQTNKPSSCAIFHQVGEGRPTAPQAGNTQLQAAISP